MVTVSWRGRRRERREEGRRRDCLSGLEEILDFNLLFLRWGKKKKKGGRKKKRGKRRKKK